MTPTEKKYKPLIGKLFWVVKLQQLVMITALRKCWGRWRVNIEYYSDNPEYRVVRDRDAIEIERLIKQGRWISAKDFLNLKEQEERKSSC